MERRKGKISISSAGGTASKDAKTYKITIPTSWINEMGFNKDNRDIELAFDGETIYARPVFCGMEYVKRKVRDGHDVKKISFYDKEELCTVIYADFTDKTVSAQNFIINPVKCAFGNNQNPSWENFCEFLEERCVPKSRAGIREYLEAIGIFEYEPLEIIKKTAGRMAEDSQWLMVEVL